jgi:hypothetical protein
MLLTPQVRTLEDVNLVCKILVDYSCPHPTSIYQEKNSKSYRSTSRGNHINSHRSPSRGNLFAPDQKTMHASYSGLYWSNDS